MSQAKGWNLRALLAFESTYGTPSTTPADYYLVPIISSDIGIEQGLIKSDELPNSRDPKAPMLDVRNGGGNAVVPVDVRNFGLWLRLLLGDPSISISSATGTITFSTNPSNNDTITINGTPFTFVTVAPTGDEIQIGVDLDATLDNAVTVLNASEDTDVDDATYFHATGTSVLTITHDTPGSGGNSFTLAASVATVSGATLTGGGVYTHTFSSGLDSLPSASFEKGFSRASVYKLNKGLVVNTLNMEFSRSGGGAQATFGCLIQDEGKDTVSVIGSGTPTTLTVTKFHKFLGTIKKDDASFGNVVNAKLDYSNNFETLDNIRGDALVDGFDQDEATLNVEFTVRLTSNELDALAEANTPIKLELAYTISASQKLTITVYEGYLPKPKTSISGPGGVQNTYNLQASNNTVAGKMLTVALVNDVETYIPS